MIEDADADMLEGFLQNMDLSKGLALMINSPGGSGLAAERIINICRNYSGTKDYWVIVPNKAKSAATMICFGASKIYMGATSELGPVDPQINIPDNILKRFSVYKLVEGYRELFEKALKEEGNLQPYLQQLAKYDEREIREFQSAIDLSNDIAIRTLETGMLSGLSKEQIQEQINIFLTPETKKIHGRPIYMNEAESCGLKIEKMDINGNLWELIYELYIRLNNFVSTRVSKCVESKKDSFGTAIPKKED